jgi:phosphatidylinositol alpha-mannosyltransferase
VGVEGVGVKRDMKIGLVCPYYLGLPGGVQRQVLGWSNQLKALGHKSVILTCGPKIDLGREDIVFLGQHLPVPTNDDIGILSFCLKNGELLKAYLKKESFDILHLHEPFTPFLSWQILSASETVNVATLHSFPEASGFLTILGTPVKAFVLSNLAKKIKKFSAVSPAASVFARGLAGEIEIIPNAIEVRSYEKGEKIKRFSDGKINLLYLGRLTKRKGILYLLKVIRYLTQTSNNFRLIIVGDGLLKEKVRGFVKRYKLKNVDFEGYVSDKQLPSYFATADIFCAPAIHGESFGIVLLEAMRVGLPIVAFANAGYKEILKDKPFCDFLAEPKDVKGFSRHLATLIANKNLRVNLGKAGFKEVQRYSWDRVGERILKFYKEALR